MSGPGAAGLIAQARAEYRRAAETWADLPGYVRTPAYEAALLRWIAQEIAAGRTDVLYLTVFALDHETGGKHPYFEFPRGGILS